MLSEYKEGKEMSASPLKSVNLNNITNMVTDEKLNYALRRSPRKRRHSCDEQAQEVGRPDPMPDPIASTQQENVGNVKQNDYLYYQLPSSPTKRKLRLVFDQSAPNKKKRIVPLKSILKASKYKHKGISPPSLDSTKEEKNQNDCSSRITLAKLIQCMSTLFPKKDFPKLAEMPSDASRLFACFALHHKKSFDSDFQLLLPLLRALVELELSYFQTKGKSKADKNTKVYFPAFNGSALQPPSDVLQGSHETRERLIQKLTNVVKIINLQPHPISLLEDLKRYLDDFSQNRYRSHALVCAESLALTSDSKRTYPFQRVQKVAVAYSKDFGCLLEPKGVSQTTSWECQLADQSAQQIRYWLRTILNPIPDRSPTYEDDAWNSRVSEIVLLQMEGEIENIAVEDGSLSSLVSDSLSFLYALFDNDNHLDQYSRILLQQTYVATDFEGPAFFKISNSNITANQWKALSTYMDHATKFLAAMNGAQFLYDLLTIIQNEPTYLELWNQHVLPTAAGLRRKVLLPEDGHLCLLQHPIAKLLNELELLLQIAQQPKQSCKSALDEWCKRLFFGRKSKHKKKHQPHLGLLEESWNETWEKIYFPRVLQESKS